MGRKSKVKLSVDEMPLREYLLRQLADNSYRDLVSNPEFVSKTGIGKLGTLTDWAGKKKFKITLNEVYEYGQENYLITPTLSYNDWLYTTGRTNMAVNPKMDKIRIRIRRTILYDMCFSLGLEMDERYTVEEIKEFILGFLNEDDFNSLYKELEKIHLENMNKK